ncbi:MAG: LemA family protein [Treponema phagedenis]|uniref:LemA family protein n=1 Tax=Treponema phagedenis TaxID=162 RepID=UPI003133FD93
MSKGLKITLIITAVAAAVIFGFYSFFAGSYNGMVKAEEGVKAAWSQVENVYQRRMDLIPNLVQTVKGYASHESKVFTDIAEARAKAGGTVQVSDEVLNNPESFAKFQKAQSELGSALQRLLVITENYPALKANQNFMDLQAQLEGTENRIAVERKRYNETVQAYNTMIRMFPKSIIANMSGFTAKPYFTADENASKAPEVKF